MGENADRETEDDGVRDLQALAAAYLDLWERQSSLRALHADEIDRNAKAKKANGEA